MKHARYRAHSDLLTLLSSRKAWDLPPYRVPDTDPHALREAALAHARANDSDPFAMGRVMLHLRMGYEFPSDVARDAQSALTRRSHEPRVAWGGLEAVKRKVDADRAWNQHNSAMFLEEKAA